MKRGNGPHTICCSSGYFSQCLAALIGLTTVISLSQTSNGSRVTWGRKVFTTWTASWFMWPPPSFAQHMTACLELLSTFIKKAAKKMEKGWCTFDIIVFLFCSGSLCEERSEHCLWFKARHCRWIVNIFESKDIFLNLLLLTRDVIMREKKK